MIKVLHVLNSLGAGGAEAFAINTVSALKNDDIECDFLIRSENNLYLDKVKSMKSNVFIAPSFPKKVFSNYKFMKKFSKQDINNYDFIHIHANSLIYILPLLLFKNSNTKIILHSHNTRASNVIASLFHKMNKLFFLKYVDIRIACSSKAGKWMFGNQSYKVIYNSIDLQKFIFDSYNREMIRDKYHIKKDELLIGSVGRLAKQKNQKFLLDVFHEILKIESKARLILVGDGPMRIELEKYSESKKINSKVTFTGAVTGVEKYYSAMDFFVLPSLYEGFPIALIEAQASDLTSVVSEESTPIEANIIDKVWFKSLASNDKDWAKYILEKVMFEKRYDRQKELYEEGFGIDSLRKNLVNLYSKTGGR
ncbi:glycosyltransferase [Enterococcus canintestini]|uniref:Glycosyl transferase family 1 domain-containing protein n=1 Tax=Enterococcus canintestini TaxID=317010 RepID=A0A267HU41_9ENTE|nr:glycosyltransferase [Enterococcus canintestini]PAB01866.1 hypothetical protein AKL21_02740 [Enterococcus canintestini]